MANEDLPSSSEKDEVSSYYNLFESRSLIPRSTYMDCDAPVTSISWSKAEASQLVTSDMRYGLYAVLTHTHPFFSFTFFHFLSLFLSLSPSLPLSFSPSPSPSYSGNIILWDSVAQSSLSRHTDHVCSCNNVDFCTTEPCLMASSSDDMTVRVWHVSMEKSTASVVAPAACLCVKWNPIYENQVCACV